MRLYDAETAGPSINRTLEIICEHLGVNKDRVTRSESYLADIGADSLDVVELVMELEEEFEVTIPDVEAEGIKSVGDAIEYIQRLLERSR